MSELTLLALVTIARQLHKEISEVSLKLEALKDTVAQYHPQFEQDFAVNLEKAKKSDLALAHAEIDAIIQRTIAQIHGQDHLQ